MEHSSIEWIKIIADFAVIFSLVVVAYQTTIAMRQLTAQRGDKICDRSLSLLARWNNLEFAAARRHVMMQFKNITSANFNEFAPVLEQDSELRGHAASVLNFFDEIAIGLNRDIYDLDIVYEFFHPIITYFWELLRPYVEWLRVRNNDATIFRATEKLYTLLQKRVYDNYAIPPGRYWSA